MSNLKLENVTDYATAKAFIGNRDRAKLGHNTYLYRHSDTNSFYVEYHGNEIIIYQPTVTYATDCVKGKRWATRTTTNRLNKLTKMSFRIRQGVHQYRKAPPYDAWLDLPQEGVNDFSKYEGVL